jgi:S1-C subfamily serine protease
MRPVITALLCALAVPRADAGGEKGSLLAQVGRELEELAAGVRPSVIQVIAEGETPMPVPGMLLPGSPFRRLRGEPSFRRRSGSGFFIDNEGHILTTDHVVRDARRIMVRLENGAEHEAQLKGRDPGMNVAVLELSGVRQAPLPLGDSDRLRPGSFVIVVGNPFGLSGSVAWGVVGGRGRTVPEIAELVDLVQVNANINPGDSGAPVIDARGEVAGILAASMGGMREGDEAPQGICFAIPINEVNSALPGLKAGGEIEHGWLGVGVQELTPALQAEFNITDGQGVIVARVIEGGPAVRAGVREGDVVRALNGAPVRSPRELIARVAAAAVGSKATLAVMRNGKETTISVQIGRRSALPAPAEPGAVSGGLGIGVEEAAPGGPGEGGASITVRDVRPGSPSAKAGLKGGDGIYEVNRKKIGSLADWEALLSGRTAGQKLLIRTQRGFFIIRAD